VHHSINVLLLIG